MRDSLRIFLERDILPQYLAFDEAHDIKHVRNVMTKAEALASEHGADAESCAVAAAYHDIGLRFGRNDHNIISARILRDDKRLREWYDENDIEKMACAIEDHRASSKSAPRSIYGMILADADREYDIHRIIERTVSFGKSEYPDMTDAEQTERAYAHISEKYGTDGYMKFWLANDRYAEAHAEILARLSDRSGFDAECMGYIKTSGRRMSVRAYLDRIGFDGEAKADADTLRRLQACHLRSVPYENMDILRGVPLSQDAETLYDKIVRRRRGGYCFELNELFGWLLRCIGFEVTDCFGRFLAGESTVPMRRHHVLIVGIPGEGARYLCDVGVGSGSPTYPVEIRAGAQDQGDFIWDMTEDGYLGHVLRQYKHDEWCKVYSFTEEPQLPADYMAASFYCEHSPASPFNKAPMISLRNANGRVTLDGDELRHFDGDKVTVEKTEDIEKTLREHFGIVL